MLSLYCLFAHPLENKICIQQLLLSEIKQYCQLFTPDSIFEKYTQSLRPHLIQPNIGTLRYALREQVAIKPGCGTNFIEVWNETIMVSCYTILQSVWQDGKRAGKIIGFVNFFQILILTQGRKFEDIKTNVTRNILETEPRRKCQELNCRNITKVKIDRNSIHFSNSRTQCNSGIIKGQTFEISSRISNTPITTFGKKNNNLNSNSFRSKNRDGVQHGKEMGYLLNVEEWDLKEV